jgi:hypothetical protein
MHKQFWLASTAAIALMAWSVLPVSRVAAQTAESSIKLSDDNISGRVTGPQGPEAGVWVIAETTDLPTRFVKIVVTDDNGRYLLPELPKANYKVWVRGYGLVDSSKMDASPGHSLDLKATAAPTERDAAQFYPAIYWLAMLQIPEKGLFPGGAANSSMPKYMVSQGTWLDAIKSNGWPGNVEHDAADRPFRHQARPVELRGLDGSDRSGGGADEQAGTTQGDRT